MLGNDKKPNPGPGQRTLSGAMVADFPDRPPEVDHQGVTPVNHLERPDPASYVQQLNATWPDGPASGRPIDEG